MNRRGFLQGILAAGVAPAVITTAGVLMPVRALWKPRGLFDGLQWGAEELALMPRVPPLTIDMIAREALNLLHENEAFVASVNRNFNVPLRLTNDILRIRVPQQYRVA